MDKESENDWKFVLYFVSIDLDALITASKQLSNQWNKCVLDIQRSNLYVNHDWIMCSEWFCCLIDMVQQLSE